MMNEVKTKTQSQGQKTSRPSVDCKQHCGGIHCLGDSLSIQEFSQLHHSVDDDLLHLKVRMEVTTQLLLLLLLQLLHLPPHSLSTARRAEVPPFLLLLLQEQTDDYQHTKQVV